MLANFDRLAWPTGEAVGHRETRVRKPDDLVEISRRGDCSRIAAVVDGLCQSLPGQTAQIPAPVMPSGTTARIVRIPHNVTNVVQILDMLGVPFQYVTGYRSSAPGRLALQRGEINMFSESPPSYRSVVEPQLVKTGQAIPVWWDEVNTDDPPPPQKQMEGLSIPSFPQLHKKIKGALPSGRLWDAYMTLFDINSTLQRLIVLPPGAPRAAYEALRSGIERLNNDKEFAAEALRTIEFVPDYPTGPDMSRRVRDMMVATPEMRNFINDYMRNVPKR